MSSHGVALAVLALFDVTARAWVHPLRKVEHTRWCAVHAAVNAVVCVFAWADLGAVWFTPESCLVSNVASGLPVCLSIWLHAYHVIFYDLSEDDRAHHLLFVVILGVPSYMYVRPITNWMLFFLNGLPGGLIYSLIALRRCGWMTTWDEPLFSAAVNLLLRAPGVFLGILCLALGMTHSSHLVPTPVLAMQIILPFGNVVYYAHQSVVRMQQRRRRGGKSTAAQQL